MATTPANNMEVKRRNRINTLRRIIASGSISQMELSQQLALSWPTILQNVKELTEMGLVEEAGQYESTGGRRAKAYAAVRNAKVAAGVEITPTHVSAAIVNLTGEVIDYLRQELEFAHNSAYANTLGELVTDFIRESGTENRLLGVGISLPGILSGHHDVLTQSHILDVEDVPTSFFSQHIPYCCTFINDANASALAEIYEINTPDCLVYLSLSTNVGGAIIYGGDLYSGHDHKAGEFGHMTLVPGGRRCYCGRNGCLDAYCSSLVLSQHTDGDLSKFFELVDAGNEEMMEVWSEYLDYLAIAVNNIFVIFDCEVIAGGYVGPYVDRYRNTFKRRLVERSTFRTDASYFRDCRYKLGPAAVGAALTQIRHYIATL